MAKKPTSKTFEYLSSNNPTLAELVSAGVVSPGDALRQHFRDNPIKPNWERDTFLPAERDTTTGATRYAVPGAVLGAGQMFADTTGMFKDAYTGKLQVMGPDGNVSPEAIERATDAAGLLTLGAGAIPARAGANGLKNLESRGNFIYDPKDMPDRLFPKDYPNGAVADASGKLTLDMDGRPITGKYVVGRTQDGGRDVALPREAYDEIATAATGAPILEVPASRLGNSFGSVEVNRATRQPRSVSVAKTDDVGKFEKVSAHEIGHVIDQASGEIPIDGLNDELRSIYNDLNNPQSYGKKFGPENNKYKGSDVQRELMAEAIRAYMTNPNYLKTVAPKTAAAIRKYVSEKSGLKDIIQFNSIAGAGILGGALTEQQFNQAVKDGNAT